ncbi:MAG: WbqC family protein [Candidatus Bathyarchaeia archaeon]
MIVAGHQPNYLPWLGFFDKMRGCDLFIVEDSVFLETKGFTARNKIKGSQGNFWLTVPTEHVGWQVPINEVRIACKGKSDWSKQHYLSMKYSYCKAPYWKDYQDFFEQSYKLEWIKFVELSMHFITAIKRFLNIKTPIVMASSLAASGTKSDLIIAQCKEVGATTYLSGIGAKDYLEVGKFEEQGIDVVFQSFEHPVYQQLYGEFVPNLSVVDYLFNTGGKSW